MCVKWRGHEENGESTEAEDAAGAVIEGTVARNSEDYTDFLYFYKHENDKKKHRGRRGISSSKTAIGGTTQAALKITFHFPTPASNERMIKVQVQ